MGFDWVLIGAAIAFVILLLRAAMDVVEWIVNRKRSKSTLKIYKFWIGPSERLVQPEKSPKGNDPGQPAIWASDCMAIGVGHTEVEAREALIAHGVSEGWEWRWLRVASVTAFEITPRWVCWVMGA